MSLQAVLAEVDPAWYATADAGGIDASLLARARASALGERILSRWLLQDGHAQALLAPNPERDIARDAVRWPRAQLALLTRDLGVLAYAPAIRSEVGRDAVRRLKQALGNSYLLALDRTVWDGRVEPQAIAGMNEALRAAMSRDDASHGVLYTLLDAQGRAELRASDDPELGAIGEWALLLQPRQAGEAVATVLPAAQVRMLYEHHLGRARSA
jgi:hypothetical protein